MKKLIVCATLALTVMLGLSGCAPGQNTAGATVVGAAAGGLASAALFRGAGSGAAIAAGALIGGSIGYIVGRRMDRQDRINMQSAIINTPDGQEAQWTNSSTGVTYIVEPQRTYRYNGWRCRRYRTKVKIDGRWRTAYGRACRTPSGWRIMR